MADPIRNTDGTVQVAPPTRSAFAPQPMQAPPPMQQSAAPPTSSGTPGFAGALLDAIKAIVGATAPRAIVDARARTNQAVDQASGGPQSLGNQF